MQFRALTDLYLANGQYVMAGQICSNEGVGVPIPAGFVPPANAVDPLTPDARTAYQQVGPQGCSDAEWRRALFTNGARWSDVPVLPPKTQWLRNPDGTFSLS
jgi:hypothetical protein